MPAFFYYLLSIVCIVSIIYFTYTFIKLASTSYKDFDFWILVLFSIILSIFMICFIIKCPIL